MLINIDTDGLEKRRQELAAELEKLDGMLAFVREFSVPVTPLEKSAEPARNGVTRHPVAGKRRAVTLALNTGPARESEIAAVLHWTQQEVSSVVASMLAAKLCFLNEHGKLQLTSAGKKTADFFMKYPKYKVYCPDKVKA